MIKGGEYLYALPVGIAKVGKSNAFQAVMLLLANNFLFIRLLLPFIDAGNQKEMFLVTRDDTKEVMPSPMLLEMLLLLHYGRFDTFQIYDHLLKAVDINPSKEVNLGDVLVSHILAKLGPAFLKLHADDWFSLKVTDQGRCSSCAFATVTKVYSMYHISIKAKQQDNNFNFKQHVEDSLNEAPDSIDGLKDKCKCRPKKHVFKRGVSTYPKFLFLNISYEENQVKELGYSSTLELKTYKVITAQEKDGQKYKYYYNHVTSTATTDYELSGMITSTNAYSHTVFIRDLLSNIWIQVKDAQVTAVNGDLPSTPKVLMYTQRKALVSQIDEWSRVCSSHTNPYIYNMLQDKKND